MKKLLSTLLAFGIYQSVIAQNVGIGTTTPNAKAILDLSSTSKGLLIPSMTTSQRFAISAPPNGLMVYDTDKNEFYHNNGTGWTPILNGGYWTRPITSRKKITNNADSVGIGTNSPTEWLDVDGNIRARNNLLADNSITATGNVNGGSLSTSGNLLTVGTGLINGDLTTNSEFIINNTDATMTLKSGGTNKGFVQLSGDNLRLGTFSGNNAKIILRSGGIDRMTIFENGNVNIGSTASNAAKLRVSGDLSVQDNVNVQNDINVSGKLTRSNISGTANLLPRCFGIVGADGTIISGTGNFTITKSVQQGEYELTFPGYSNTNTIFTGTCTSVGAFPNNGGIVTANLLTSYIAINTRYHDGAYSNASFSFIIYQAN